MGKIKGTVIGRGFVVRKKGELGRKHLFWFGSAGGPTSVEVILQ